ncbi:MAG TPA: hypothetical protein VLQ68_05030, partial [Rhizobiaceae bacterium]|nr:hypothetical protein [Rhizobiaceae bacterium]
MAVGLAASGAARAQEKPAAGCRPCRASELVEVLKLDPSIRLDMPYARPQNITGRTLYAEERAFCNALPPSPWSRPKPGSR